LGVGTTPGYDDVGTTVGAGAETAAGETTISAGVIGGTTVSAGRVIVEGVYGGSAFAFEVKLPIENIEDFLGASWIHTKS